MKTCCPKKSVLIYVAVIYNKFQNTFFNSATYHFLHHWSPLSIKLLHLEHNELLHSGVSLSINGFYLDWHRVYYFIVNKNESLISHNFFPLKKSILLVLYSSEKSSSPEPSLPKFIYLTIDFISAHPLFGPLICLPIYASFQCVFVPLSTLVMMEEPTPSQKLKGEECGMYKLHLQLSTDWSYCVQSNCVGNELK